LVVVVLWRVFAKPRRLPYSKRSSLLTAGELRFYRVLQAVPPGLPLFVKVRLMDAVSMPEEAWATHGAPAGEMRLGFGLVDAATTEPQRVLESDDRSHW
jgi:hypothetical protein